jgi:hypothetical protein
VWINPGSQDTQVSLSLPTGFSDVRGYAEVQAEVKWVQTEGASASQENITGWPHGFGFQSCMRYAKVEYRGHGIHGSDSRRSNGGGTPGLRWWIEE